MTEDETKKTLAKSLNLKYFDSLKEFDFVQKKIKMIEYSLAKESLLLPIEEKDGRLVLAIYDPLNLEAINEVKFLLGREIILVCASRAALEEGMQLCFQHKKEETEHLFKAGEEQENKELTEEYDLLERSHQNPIIQIVNAIIMEAIEQGASDIHFEPQEDGLLVRYRIDGILQKRRSPPKEQSTQIITRLKVMAKLDIAERRLPQDGRIKLRLGKKEIDFRVSAIPTIYGERIVLRILDKSNLILGLEKLGMPERILAQFRKLIEIPEGIILVTGPTGSGKTTTLYSAIAELATAEMNIMTIEDPVEYKIPNIAQIAVNPKINLNFARGLRHILRQDPDIIMIGEIRDLETAQVAIQSALTGHLVFSTLHTNDAPSALTRLADMGIEPYLLSASIIGVLAQRLVRVICPKCRYERALTKVEKELFLELKTEKVSDANGCGHCYQSGYRNRIGIYELMVMDNNIKKQVTSEINLEKIKSLLKESASSLRSSGLSLVAQGTTTLSEVLKATKIME